MILQYFNNKEPIGQCIVSFKKENNNNEIFNITLSVSFPCERKVHNNGCGSKSLYFQWIASI